MGTQNFFGDVGFDALLSLLDAVSLRSVKLSLCVREGAVSVNAVSFGRLLHVLVFRVNADGT